MGKSSVGRVSGLSRLSRKESGSTSFLFSNGKNGTFFLLLLLRSPYVFLLPSYLDDIKIALPDYIEKAEIRVTSNK